MQKSLLALTLFLFPLTSFAESYKCEFVDQNDLGASGFVEAKKQPNGQFSIQLVITVDGETDEATVDNDVIAEEGHSQFEIEMFYAYYMAAHNGEGPVAMNEIQSVKGMRYEEKDFELSFLIFRDASENVLDQTFLINGSPLACKR